MDSLGRDVFGIANGAIDEETKVFHPDFSSLDAFAREYLPLFPPEPIYIAGHSSGGNIAMLIAAARIAKGLPVKGLILLDAFNAEGFEERSDCPWKASQFFNKCVFHTVGLMPGFRAPVCNVPTLLIRATADVEKTIGGWTIPSPAPYETNLWTTEMIPNLDIAVVEGANHATLWRDPV